MKNENKNRHNQRGAFILFLMAIFFLQSCDTEIPELDNEPPTFMFRITGDGFDQSFDQETDFDSFQLNLREDAEYDIIFSAGDTGGMKQIQWQFASDYVELETPVASPWVLSNSGLSTLVTWRGDSANPVTGMVFTGTFRAHGDLVSYTFDLMAEDFGGATSMENRSYGTLNIFSGNHTTEIVYF